MSNLIPFDFNSSQIRVVTNNIGEPLFVVKDVMLALGYSIDGGISKYIKHVPDEWKGGTPISTPGGVQEMAVLSEQGLYFFVNRSDKEKAIPFQKWVAGEVIPSIRKTGSYSLVKEPEQQKEAINLVPSVMAAATAFGFTGNMAILKADHAVKMITGCSALELLDSLHIKADSRGMTYTPTELGKKIDGGVSAQNVNKLLQASGLQYRDVNNRWEVTDKGKEYAEVLDTNKVQGGVPVKQIKWFGTVLDFINSK